MMPCLSRVYFLWLTQAGRDVNEGHPVIYAHLSNSIKKINYSLLHLEVKY